MLTRCEDYLAMGVPEVWVVHPAKRPVLIVRPGNVLETRHEGILTLANTPIAVPLADVFAVLDEA